MGASGAELAAPVAAENGAHPVKYDVRHLDFYYGGSQALKDINLTPTHTICTIR